MDAIQELDSVRIVKLLTPRRHISSSQGCGRQPAVGDDGVVVHIYTENGEPAGYIVECVAFDGMTVWLADFEPDEVQAL